jgi:hypothetical protein
VGHHLTLAGGEVSTHFLITYCLYISLLGLP